MSFVAATRDFERWTRRVLARDGRRVHERDLADKHAPMPKRKKKAAFGFLRATYYRWAERWPRECPELAAAPHVLAVGDLHLENFGTWRDREGRLCWGVNDFDEAHPLAYTNDLVRLAASAFLAKRARRFAVDRKAVCQAILKGYRDALDKGGRAIRLAE